MVPDAIFPAASRNNDWTYAIEAKLPFDSYPLVVDHRMLDHCPSIDDVPM